MPSRKRGLESREVADITSVTGFIFRWNDEVRHVFHILGQTGRRESDPHCRGSNPSLRHPRADGNQVRHFGEHTIACFHKNEHHRGDDTPTQLTNYTPHRIKSRPSLTTQFSIRFGEILKVGQEMTVGTGNHFLAKVGIAARVSTYGFACRFGILIGKTCPASWTGHTVAPLCIVALITCGR